MHQSHLVKHCLGGGEGFDGFRGKGEWSRPCVNEDDEIGDEGGMEENEWRKANGGDVQKKKADEVRLG